MDLSTHFRMNIPKVVHEAFDDNEVVIINLDTGSYYSLDKVGAEIWSLIESGASITEIIEGMSCRYEAGSLNIEGAVNLFIEELRQEDLIVPNANERTGGALKANENMKSEPGAAKLSFQKPVLQKYTDMQDLLLLDPIHEVDETGWPKSKKDL